eukprot:3006011-Prymnesium_polylepis.1
MADSKARRGDQQAARADGATSKGRRGDQQARPDGRQQGPTGRLAKPDGRQRSAVGREPRVGRGATVPNRQRDNGPDEQGGQQSRRVRGARGSGTRVPKRQWDEGPEEAVGREPQAFLFACV